MRSQGTSGNTVGNGSTDLSVGKRERQAARTPYQGPSMGRMLLIDSPKALSMHVRNRSGHGGDSDSVDPNNRKIRISDLIEDL